MEYDDDDYIYIDEDEVQPDSVNQTLHLTVLYVAFGVVALAGNLLIVRALIVYKNLRVPLFLTVCAISIADLLSVVLNIPFMVYRINKAEEEIPNVGWTTVNSYVYNVTSYIVAYHIIGLAVLRGFILTDRSHKFPKSCHVITAGVVVFVIAALTNVPLLMNPETDVFAHHCVVDKSSKAKSDFLLKTFFSYIIPILGIVFVYVVTRSLRKRYFDESYPKEERHSSRFITVTVFVFIVCQSPVNIVNLVLFNRDLTPEDGEENSCGLFAVRKYLLCLSVLDKALRPVLYAGLSKSIGESLDEVINCTLCQRRTEPEESANQPMHPSVASTIVDDPV